MLDAYPFVGSTIDSSQLPAPGRLRRLAARGGFRTGSLRQYPFEGPLFHEDDSGGCWDPRVSTLSGPVILRGYFQSERYFDSIATQLRAELTPLSTSGEAFTKFKREILQAGHSSVSVHIRRGDYANEPATLSFHGLLGPEFYVPALALLRDRAPAAQVFVFSDDPLEAAALLPEKLSVTMVSGRGLSDVEELALMSTCHHHVIANSSFSWWGAWLGSPNGLTIAPSRWFAQHSEAAIRDRFPAHWHVVG